VPPRTENASLADIPLGTYISHTVPVNPQARTEIRQAESEELDEVAWVWHESASHMDAAATPMPTFQELRSRIDRELDAGWELYVAVRSERIIGMLALRTMDRVLDQIFVLPSEQFTGVGTRLLNEAKRAMPQGFTLRMALANERAGRFYERSGMKMLQDAIHPISGIPVRYFGWSGS
jgi:GNAT superfamily N-acetyltransferase